MGVKRPKPAIAPGTPRAPSNNFTQQINLQFYQRLRNDFHSRRNNSRHSKETNTFRNLA